MGAVSKWIKFEEYEDSILTKPKWKTKIFCVRNRESDFILGWIKWYGPFRQYSFFPCSDTVFEKTCLQDITNFVKGLMEERKLLKGFKHARIQEAYTRHNQRD